MLLEVETFLYVYILTFNAQQTPYRCEAHLLEGNNQDEA
jgi:hypothetical protein